MNISVVSYTIFKQNGPKPSVKLAVLSFLRMRNIMTIANELSLSLPPPP